MQTHFLPKLIYGAIISAVIFTSAGYPARAAANDAPRAVISAPDSVNERAAADISGTQSSGPGDAIASYNWSLENPDDLNLAIEDPGAANTRLVIGEIQTTADVTLTLKVSDNAGATASAQTVIRIVEVDAARLPPMPDEQMSMQTVQGIDTDDDGVRDDMEHSIYDLYPLDTPRREILLLGAQAMQMQLLAGEANSQAASDAATERAMEFVACAMARDDIQILQQNIAILELFALNTDARRQALFAYEALQAAAMRQPIDPGSANCAL